MKILNLLALVSLTLPQIASANFLLPTDLKQLDDYSTYQIGAEWGKKVVTPVILEKANPAFVRAAFATAKVGGGTGFYLGKFGDYHVIGTNHHVCPAGYACLGTYAKFPLLGKDFKIVKFLGTFNNVDTTLLAIQVNAADESTLAPFAKNFAFKKDTYHLQELITIGFGIGNNPKRELVANQDSDCVVFSNNGEYRFMKDPDDLNPGEDTVWSFSNGCDVSHGDSGSAMVDRITGEVMGIIWTGRIPKDPKIQNASFVASLKANPDSKEVWTQLSYAVPAVKIGEYLYQATQQPNTNSESRQVFLNMLDAR